MKLLIAATAVGLFVGVVVCGNALLAQNKSPGKPPPATEPTAQELRDRVQKTLEEGRAMRFTDIRERANRPIDYQGLREARERYKQSLERGRQSAPAVKQ